MSRNITRLRGQDQHHDAPVDQDTAGKHPASVQPPKPVNKRTPHQDAQWGADVRGDVIPGTERSNEAPNGLRRRRKDPLNRSSGRRAPSRGGRMD